MAYTVALANHKGGVGKTFSAIRISIELAGRGQRVLLIDADAQAHATLYFLGVEGMDRLALDLSDLLKGESLRVLAVETPCPGLRLIPSSLSVAEMEFGLMADLGRRDRRLREAISKVRSDYDFVIIDCPPSLSLMTVNALAAADGIVTPVELTNFALNGMARFLRWLEEFRTQGIVTARLLGVLPTKYDSRELAGRDGLRALHNTGLPLFDPVPRRTAVERLVASQGSPWNGDEPPELAQPYATVGSAILAASGVTLTQGLAL